MSWLIQKELKVLISEFFFHHTSMHIYWSKIVKITVIFPFDSSAIINSCDAPFRGISLYDYHGQQVCMPSYWPSLTWNPPWFHAPYSCHSLFLGCSRWIIRRLATMYSKSAQFFNTIVRTIRMYFWISVEFSLKSGQRPYTMHMTRPNTKLHICSTDHSP